MAAERVFPAVGPVASGRGLVASSFQYYLTGDESLRVETISSNVPGAIVDVGVRLWREDDRAVIIERERHVCLPPTLSQKDYALPAGALLNLRLSTTTSNARYGRLFVRAQLIRGGGAAADVVGTLTQGYISPQNDRAWPGSPVEQMKDSPGVVVNPGWVINVGPRLDMTVPASTRYRVISGRCQYTAAAVVANRYLFTIVTDSIGNTIWAGGTDVAITAGTTWTLAFAAGLGPSSVVAPGFLVLPWPNDLDLSAGQTASIVPFNPQAGDTLTGGALTVREWMEQ
jgi:hypothetical protein